MKHLSALLAVPFLACAAQTVHAQTNKGAVAIEDCIAFESNLLGSAPASRQVQIKKGEVFSLGRLLPPDFHHTVRDKGLMRVYYIQSPGSQAQKHIWVPEKSVKEFDADAGPGNLGKATIPWEIRQGERGPRWQKYFADAARAAAPEVFASPQTQQTTTQAAVTSANQAAATPEPAAQPKPEPITGGPGVYILYSVINPFGANRLWIWKDGKSYEIEDSSCYSMYVDNENVYLAGSGSNKAILWVNGEKQQLEESVASEATAVFASGKDVYVAGTIGAGDAIRPVLWKNGERQVIGETKGKGSWRPSAIFVSGSEVTVTGINIDNGVSGAHYSMIWRNGKETKTEKKSILPNHTDYFKTSNIANGDAYAFSISLDHLPDMELFKNGKKHPIAINKEWRISSIYVSGNDVYFLGRAKLWKNGIEQKLEGWENPNTLEDVKTSANCVFVAGKDVYVAGTRSAPYNDTVLWKNGKAQTIEKFEMSSIDKMVVVQ